MSETHRVVSSLPDTKVSPHQGDFDEWVRSGEPAGADTLFIYQHWVESMSLPVLGHRSDGTIIDVNPGCSSLLNRPRNECVGRHIGELFGSEWFTVQQQLLDAATADAPDFETQIRFDVGGEERLYSITSTALFTSAGQVGFVMLVMKDMTSEAQATNELRRANQLLNESNRDLEEFAYVASHDLQEPLRKIQAFGDRLRSRIENDVDEKSLDYLTRMESASQRMHSLINDLLTFSRVTTTGRSLTPVALEHVVKSVLADLEVAVADANATVNIGPLPTIDADEPQLKQLMQNLIGNALKFRDPERAPEIWIEGVMLGQRWLISVRDNGIGFEQGHADKIFMVFQRLHGRTAYEGTGVGLAICRKIVERHGGTIQAHGDPGEGATFTIDIPRSLNELKPLAA